MMGWIHTDKLYPFERNPLVVSRPPKSALLSELTEEGDNSLRPIFIRSGQIYLVAKDDQPFTTLYRLQNHAFLGSFVFAMLFNER